MEIKEDEIADPQKLTEASYILREYFKGFKIQPSELMQIRDKINKTDRNAILDGIVKQNSQIYNIIAENYFLIIDKFEKIAEEINHLNDCINISNVDNQQYSTLNYSYYKSSLDEIDSIESHNKETETPISIRQLNINIDENINKIQQLQNELDAKINFIENKLSQVKDDENFLIEIDEEKNLYVENIYDDDISELLIGDTSFIHTYLYKFFKVLFEYVYKINIELDENNFQNEKIKAKFMKEFKNQIYNKKIENMKNKIKESESEFLRISEEKLREINQILEIIKSETNKIEKDKNYINFIFPIYKSLKLIIFMCLSKKRIEKNKETIEIDRDVILNINNRINEHLQRNQILEKLRKEITKKYENRGTLISEKSLICKEADNMNKTKQKDAITKLKLYHNELENNYVLLLKNISKKIMKPKDLIRKLNAEQISKKIK